MKHIYQITLLFAVVLLITSCSTTKQMTISMVEPSPVDFSKQIRKIGIVNNSESSFVKGYTTRVEQLIVMEERWLADKGTAVALTGLFDELAEDKRFDTVRILDNLEGKMTDFGTSPSEATWNKIAAICEENDVDAIFSLASHDSETQYSLKKAKVAQLGMMRDRNAVQGQEVTLETLIENGWRVYDPKQRILVDEFTSNDQIVASAKGISPLDALQAIDQRKQTLLSQSKNAGSSYGQRMQPQKLEVQRDYYVLGTQNFVLAETKIESGAYSEAGTLWKNEIENSKPRIGGRACYNLAVLSEYGGDLTEALSWANKAYKLHKDEATLEYINELERRKEHTVALKTQMADLFFED